MPTESLVDLISLLKNEIRRGEKHIENSLTFLVLLVCVLLLFPTSKHVIQLLQRKVTQNENNPANKA